MSKFELGPLQKQWLQSLKDNPSRQTSGRLGQKYSDGTYKACCLGEAGLIAGVCEWTPNNLEISDENVTDVLALSADVSFGYFYLDGESYKAIGLRSKRGDSATHTTKDCLAELNDSVKTWPEIAELIEANPEEYFVESK